MKAYMNCVIGNNAVRIVETKHKIKIINIYERKDKRTFFRNMVITISVCAMLVFCCYGIVHTHNQNLLIQHNISRLNNEIVKLEKEKQDLLNVEETTKMDYGKVYQIAKVKFGMKFPNKNQVYYYNNQKGTMIRGKI